MGEVVGAGLLAHVPTIMLPEADRRELNNGQEISLVPGLRRLRSEVFEKLDYDTVVVLDSHWFTTVEFVISAHDVRAGLFTSDELLFLSMKEQEAQLHQPRHYDFQSCCRRVQLLLQVYQHKP